MQWTEACGYLGSLLSSITFLPQVIKTWQTKSAGDLSLLMLCIVFISTVVWLVYAFALHLLPVIICNSIVCVLSIFLLYFKLTYRASDSYKIGNE
jgi:MtN3 and saliva related transmembrane protein